MAIRGDVGLGRSGFGRVAGVRQLSNGSFFVTDAQSHEAVILDSLGNLLAIAARAGRGPGEFEYPGPPLSFGADSIAVIDPELRRIVLFDEAGKYVAGRAFPMQTPDGVLWPVGLLSSKRIVGLMLGLEMPTTIGERVTRSDRLVLGEPGSFTTEPVATSRGTQMIGGLWREGGGELVSAYELPFGETTKVGVSPTRIYLGETGKAQLRVFNHSGRSVGTFTWSAPRGPVSPEDRRNWFVQESTAIASSTIPVAAHTDMFDGLRSISPARNHPAFVDFLVGEDESLWIDTETRTWLSTRLYLVLRPDGSPRARILVPRSFRLFQADSTSVLGVWREPGAAHEVREYLVIR